MQLDPVGRALEHMALRLNAVEAELHAVRAASQQRPKLITDEGSIAQEAEASEYRI